MSTVAKQPKAKTKAAKVEIIVGDMVSKHRMTPYNNTSKLPVFFYGYIIKTTEKAVLVHYTGRTLYMSNMTHECDFKEWHPKSWLELDKETAHREFKSYEIKKRYQHLID